MGPWVVNGAPAGAGAGFAEFDDACLGRSQGNKAGETQRATEAAGSHSLSTEWDKIPWDGWARMWDVSAVLAFRTRKREPMSSRLAW